MRKILSLLASALLPAMLPLSAGAQDFVQLRLANYLVGDSVRGEYTAQFELGRLFPTDSVAVEVEYPEYRPLTAAQSRALARAGIAKHSAISPVVSVALSRGNAVAEVAFPPFVWREGRFCFLESFKITPRVTGVRVSQAFRKAYAVTEKVSQTMRYAEKSVLSTGRWMKIRVSSEGLYQLTDAELAQMGFSDPSRVKLYCYGGRRIQEKFAFADANGLVDDLPEVPLYRRSGSVVFFAEGTVRYNSDGTHVQNPYSLYSYYFLTEGDSPAAFSQLPSQSSAGEEVAQVRQHALYDGESYSWYSGGRDFFDSTDMYPSGQTFTLPLPGLVAGSTSTVLWETSAASTSGSTRVQLSVDGSSLHSLSVAAYGSNESARASRGRFTTSRLSGPSAAMTLTSTHSARLNYVHVLYTQALSAQNTTQPFQVEGVTGAFTLAVAGATGSTAVWQLPDATHTLAALSGTLSGSTYRAAASDATARYLVADLSATYPSPEVVGEVANQNLHADTAADFVMIVPASGKLTSQAERLAAYHTGKGLRTRVVRADQLYNEFSSGTPDASAYRRYMKMLYDRAATDADRPRYLLLFGDCMWDNRQVTSEMKSYDAADFLLAYETNDAEDFSNTSYAVGTLNSFVTDDYYGLLDDGEGADMSREKIDLGIGRFLCHDADAAAYLVDQTIAYGDNKQNGSWKNMMFAIGDNGDNNLHMEDAQAVAKQANTSSADHFLVRYLFQDFYTPTQSASGFSYPQATAKLKSYMQQGALVFNYNGHGSPDQLSHRFLIMKEDFSSNISTARPLWLFASCEIDPYDHLEANIGQNILFNRNGGGIAVICASRTVYSSYNKALNVALVKYLFRKDSEGNRYTLGDAMRLAKCDMLGASSGGGRDYTTNKMKYVLLGDPALALAWAEDGVVVDSINGEPLTPSSFHSLKAGEVVRFSGYVNGDGSTGPDTSFEGTLEGVVFDRQSTLTCKGSGNSTASPLQYKDYTKMLYRGSVEVKGGRFSLSFIVPRGISFSKDAGLLNLYAVSSDASKGYGGANRQFCFNGTADNAESDTIGPQVYIYLDTPDFPDGGTVGSSADFYATVQDSTAVSVMSGNMGHDITLTLDGDAANAVQLNDFFSFDFGSYSSGTVQYTLSGLSEGKHSLDFRVWDVFGNSTSRSLTFLVDASGKPSFDVRSTDNPARGGTTFVTSFPDRNNGGDNIVRTEVFSLSGQCVWSAQTSSTGSYVSMRWDGANLGGAPLSPGVYLYRSRVNGKSTKSKKLIVM